MIELGLVNSRNYLTTAEVVKLGPTELLALVEARRQRERAIDLIAIREGSALSRAPRQNIPYTGGVKIRRITSDSRPNRKPRLHLPRLGQAEVDRLQKILDNI